MHKGEEIGSTEIDRKFKDLVRSRLRVLKRSGAWNGDEEVAAWDMMTSSQFLDPKCSYGSPSLPPYFSVAVPELDRSYSNAEMGILQGSVKIDR